MRGRRLNRTTIIVAGIVMTVLLIGVIAFGDDLGITGTAGDGEQVSPADFTETAMSALSATQNAQFEQTTTALAMSEAATETALFDAQQTATAAAMLAPTETPTPEPTATATPPPTETNTPTDEPTATDRPTDMPTTTPTPIVVNLNVVSVQADLQQDMVYLEVEVQGEEVISEYRFDFFDADTNQLLDRQILPKPLASPVALPADKLDGKIRVELRALDAQGNFIKWPGERDRLIDKAEHTFSYLRPTPTPPPATFTAIPVEVELGSISYDKESDIISLDVVLIGAEQMETLEINILDADTNLRVSVYPNIRPADTINIRAENLEPNQEYIVYIEAESIGGQTRRSNESSFVYTPILTPTPTPTVTSTPSLTERPLEIAIEELSIDEDRDALVVRFRALPDDRVASYALQVRNAISGLVLAEYIHTPPPFEFYVPLAELPSGEYVVILRALDANGEMLFEAPPLNFAYSPPPTPTEDVSSEGPTFTPTRTPTPLPTETAAPTETPDAELTQIAMVPVEVADISGAVIARGIARLYAPKSLDVGQSDIVRLELELTRRIQTPTPAPEDDEPVSEAEETALAAAAEEMDVPTATPPRLIAATLIPNIRERMGATLDCTEGRFTGCPETNTDWATNRHFKRVSSQITTWTWPLEPLPGISGDQPLTVELWWLDEDGFRAIEWSHPFTINVGGAAPGAGTSTDSGDDDSGGLAPLLIALIAAGGVSALGGGGAVMLRRRRAAQATQAEAVPSVPLATIFVSYRREGGWATANMLHDRLSALGGDVFLDTHSIHEGRFNQIITRAISDRDYFVVVLAPGTLDSEWVVKETELAISLGKTVIPVLIDGFRFGDVALPAEIATLNTYNGVRLDREYLDASIDKLAEFTGLKPKAPTEK